jgi:hypothetical protein
MSVFEAHITSIFWVKEQAEQEIDNKKAASIAYSMLVSWSAYSLTLTMVETLLHFYCATWSYNPEECTLHSH